MEGNDDEDDGNSLKLIPIKRDLDNDNENATEMVVKEEMIKMMMTGLYLFKKILMLVKKEMMKMVMITSLYLSKEMQMMVKEETKLKRTGSTPVIVQRNRPMKPAMKISLK